MKTRETIKKEASQISEQDRKTFEALIEEINTNHTSLRKR